MDYSAHSNGLRIASDLFKLPNEIIQLIACLLPNSDIKNLRLACRNLSNLRLRFDRVYLSANPRNIEVFHAIAADEKYRKQVVEIVWDCALYQFLSENRHTLGENEDENHDRLEWFESACQYGLVVARNASELQILINRLENGMSTKDSFAYYRQLHEQQMAIEIRHEDTETLEMGLKLFPALRRITITPKIHGTSLTRSSLSPMIRSFPKGLNYPIPWPFLRYSRICGCEMTESEGQDLFDKFSDIVLLLASRLDEHNIRELVIEVNGASSGMQFRTDGFDDTCFLFKNLVLLFGKPGFRRLDLAMTPITWRNTCDRHIEKALAAMRKAFATPCDLEHFHFQSARLTIPDTLEPYFVPLLNIFPVTQWKRLTFFSLSWFVVDMDDLLHFLSQLPQTLQVVELNALYFLEGCLEQLLTCLRDEASWQSRSNHPKLVVGIDNRYGGYESLTMISDEIDSFLYHGGTNPFEQHVLVRPESDSVNIRQC